MPDQRAINALSGAWHSAREAIHAQLRRDGYNPWTLKELPAAEERSPLLAAAIERWQAIEDGLDAAWARPIGRRY